MKITFDPVKNRLNTKEHGVDQGVFSPLRGTA
jgi:uncharacterized DUF497 family protein